jgi:hypothetical protein
LRLHRFDVDRRQLAGQQEAEVGRLAVVARRERAEEQAELLQILPLGERARPEMQEGDAVAAQEDDVPRVEIAVVEVVLEQLAQERENQPPRQAIRIDVVGGEPARQPLWILATEPDEIRHQRRVNELADEDPARSVRVEHFR